MDGKLKENVGSHISAIFNHLSYSVCYTPGSGGVSLYVLGRLMRLPPLSRCQDPGECSAPDHHQQTWVDVGCQNIQIISKYSVCFFKYWHEITWTLWNPKPVWILDQYPKPSSSVHLFEMPCVESALGPFSAFHRTEAPPVAFQWCARPSRNGQRCPPKRRGQVRRLYPGTICKP